MTIQITAEQLAQLSLTTHQWDRLNAEEQEAVFMQIEYADQVGEPTDDGAPADPAKPRVDPGELDDIPILSTAPAPPKPAATAPAAPAAPAVAEPVPGPTAEEQQAEDLRLLAFDYAAPTTAAAPEDTAKLQTQYDAIVADKAKLKAQVDDGSLSIADAMEQRDALTMQAVDISQRIARATEAANVAPRVQKERWDQAQTLFLARPASAVYGTDAVAYSGLSTFVAQLSRDPKIAARGFMTLLFEADRALRAKHPSLFPGAATPAAPAPKPPKPAPRIADKSGVPTTLSAVPAADIHADGDEPWSDIDALEGPEYEAALRKMPRDKRDQYLASLNR